METDFVLLEFSTYADFGASGERRKLISTLSLKTPHSGIFICVMR